MVGIRHHLHTQLYTSHTHTTRGGGGRQMLAERHNDYSIMIWVEFDFFFFSKRKTVAIKVIMCNNRNRYSSNERYGRYVTTIKRVREKQSKRHLCLRKRGGVKEQQQQKMGVKSFIDDFPTELESSYIPQWRCLLLEIIVWSRNTCESIYRLLSLFCFITITRFIGPLIGL